MTDATTVSIVLADDHEYLREGMKTVLKKMKHVSLLAEAPNGKQLLEMVNKHRPDVVITDIKMPEMDGIMVTRSIRKAFPWIKVIALSSYDEEELITDMIDAGADGYLLKNSSRQEMSEAITSVMMGKSYYCKGTSNKLLANYMMKKKVSTKKINFTPREIDVMRLICKGMKNKEVAKELSISPRTVESHRKSILEKLDVKSAVEIALYAKSQGYI